MMQFFGFCSTIRSAHKKMPLIFMRCIILKSKEFQPSHGMKNIRTHTHILYLVIGKYLQVLHVCNLQRLVNGIRPLRS